VGSVAASITFSAIPATYEHLKIVLQGRGDTAAESVLMQLRFNGDTAGNYDDQRDVGKDGSTISAGSAGSTSGAIGEIVGANGGANRAGIVEIAVPYYTRTTWAKVAQSVAAAPADGARVSLNTYVFWNNTAAITSITLFPVTGNFAIGTIATLYGV